MLTKNGTDKTHLFHLLVAKAVAFIVTLATTLYQHVTIKSYQRLGLKHIIVRGLRGQLGKEAVHIQRV